MDSNMLGALTFICWILPRVQGDLELHYSLQEEKPAGTLLADLLRDASLADKYDIDVLGELRFQFLTEPRLDVVIGNRSGLIRTKSRLNREQLCRGTTFCEVVLDVAIQPVRYFEIIKIKVAVTDLNDNWPQFPDSRVVLRILESAIVGTSFYLPEAMDLDSPEYGVQKYEIEIPSDVFDLRVSDQKLDGSRDVRLVLKQTLDRERQGTIQIRVIAFDGGKPSKTGHLDVNIAILDANDNDPAFERTLYSVSMYENLPVGSTIVQVQAADQDSGVNGELHYAFTSQTQHSFGDLFGIDDETGGVFVKRLIDYESVLLYYLGVVARDQGPDSLPAEATVVVKVLDLNDIYPRITINTLDSRATDKAYIQESVKLGTFVGHMSVVDGDSGENGEVTCTIDDTNFKLIRSFYSEYKIVTAAILDRESQAEHSILIRCQDRGSEALESSMRLTVNMLDDNDNSPSFSQPIYTGSVYENSSPGIEILQILATDRDIGLNGHIRYHLPVSVSHLFAISSKTGIISATRPLDREQSEQFDFPVLAIDEGTPSQTGTARVTITIRDVNDQKPEFSQSAYSFGIFENEGEGSRVGMVMAFDNDGPGFNAFILNLSPRTEDENSSLPFVLDPSSGVISTTRVLDREENSTYVFLVKAIDSGVPPLTGTAEVTVFVADKNDNIPIVTFPKANNQTLFVDDTLKADFTIFTFHARDEDIGPNGKVTYRLFSGDPEELFYLDLDTGELILKKTPSKAKRDLYHLHVLIADQGIPKQINSVFLNVALNRTNLYAQTAGLNAAKSDTNLTVVVALACITLIIVSILILAIVCLLKKDDERLGRLQYILRFVRFLPKIRCKRFTRNQICRPKAKCGAPARRAIRKDKKEVSFSLEMSSELVLSPGKGQTSNSSAWLAHIDQQGLQYPLACSSLLTSMITASPSELAARNLHQQVLARQAAHQPAYEMQHLMRLLGRDHDRDSNSSRNGSNTDSGRGPSEEDDGPSHGSIDDQSTQRIVAAPSDNCSSTQMTSTAFDRSEMSVCSQQPLLQSFASKQRQQNCSITSQSSNYSTAIENTVFELVGGRAPNLNTGFVKSTPGVVTFQDPLPCNRFSSVGDSACEDSDENTFEESKADLNTPVRSFPAICRPDHDEISLDSFSQTSDTQGEFTGCSDNRMLYSCADVSDALRMKTPGQTPTNNTALESVAETMEDDAVSYSTTSGTYEVVDPQELCAQIDELFFGDIIV